jgi:hypothetical protein
MKMQERINIIWVDKQMRSKIVSNTKEAKILKELLHIFQEYADDNDFNLAIKRLVKSLTIKEMQILHSC